MVLSFSLPLFPILSSAQCFQLFPSGASGVLRSLYRFLFHVWRFLRFVLGVAAPFSCVLAL